MSHKETIVETKLVTLKTVGFEYSLSVEKEQVVPVEGTRASAKTTTKECASGHTDQKDQMWNLRDEMRKKLGLEASQ